MVAATLAQPSEQIGKGPNARIPPENNDALATLNKRESIRMDNSVITRDEVLERLAYDEATGVFTYRRKVGRGSAGKVAGNVGSRGYVNIIIRGRHVKAHRLAWLCIYGEFPEAGKDVDHADRDKTNNARANLRLCSRAQNNANTARGVRNKSGVKGVCWHSRAGKWAAQIKLGGKQKHLGYFVDKLEAAAAYRHALIKHFGEFARID